VTLGMSVIWRAVAGPFPPVISWKELGEFSGCWSREGEKYRLLAWLGSSLLSSSD